jgi:hypothetical protein
MHPSYILPLVSAPVLIALPFAPAHWLGDDPTSGYALAVLGLSACGVLNAGASVFSRHWPAFAGRALLAHAGLFMVLMVIGVAGPLRDAGPAGMVLLMPILFPALAFGLAAVVRLCVALLRR